jgi:hypothetical protein
MLGRFWVTSESVDVERSEFRIRNKWRIAEVTKRKSGILFGVGDDAAYLAERIAARCPHDANEFVCVSQRISFPVANGPVRSKIA